MPAAIARIFLSIAGTDLSASMQSFTSSLPVATQDAATMNDTWTEPLPGMKSWTMSGAFIQNFDAAAIDSVLWPLHGTLVAVVYRPSTAVVGVNNPQYTGTAVLAYDQIAGGGTGDLQTGSFTLTGNGALARAVA